MGTYQVAYIDPTKSQTHVVDSSAGLGAASNMVTSCGRPVLSFGPFLPTTATSWPAQDAPWCDGCMATVG